jgi:hypothetical protein
MDNGARPGEVDRVRRAAPQQRRPGGAPAPPAGWAGPKGGPRPAEPGAGAPAAGGITEAGGLCAFNIGLVPASVTPPRTWRQAAWFTVLCSAAVLAGLMVIAALIGSPRPYNRIDTLPGYPSAVPPVVPPPGGTGRPAVSRPVQLAAGAETGVQDWPPVRAPGRFLDARAGMTVPGDGGRPSGDPPVPMPSVETETGDGPAVVDGETIFHQTQLYYDSLVGDLSTAYAMTTGPLHADGAAALAARYWDVAAVRLAEVSVDPGHAVTTNVLRITRLDGATRTERRVLVFAPGAEPKVSDERPA